MVIEQRHVTQVPPRTGHRVRVSTHRPVKIMYLRGASSALRNSESLTPRSDSLQGFIRNVINNATMWLPVI